MRSHKKGQTCAEVTMGTSLTLVKVHYPVPIMTLIRTLTLTMTLTLTQTLN